MPCFLSHLGIVNGLGSGADEISRNLLAGNTGARINDWSVLGPCYVAALPYELPPLPALPLRYQSRNNQLAWAALLQIKPHIEQLIARFGKDRIAVVLGTSTSGIAEGEHAAIQTKTGARPTNYCYQQQEIGTVAEFIAYALDLGGPAYTISTACSSSGHALNSAQQLLATGLADAVITGGVDSLCRLTVNGFAALESVSSAPCTPFSKNRNGITIGEAAALFIATQEPSGANIELLAAASSSDAHHISAPDPEGHGAERAIRAALESAQLTSSDIDYINLHGTGTRLNDAMESTVIHRIFGPDVPCSSSKGQVGHCLGAAAANELALCWLSLQDEFNPEHLLPPHLWDGCTDPSLAPLLLADNQQRYPTGQSIAVLSNSFAFGGNNTAVIIRAPKLKA